MLYQLSYEDQYVLSRPMFILLKLRLQQRRWHINFICIPAVQINFISRLIPVTGKDDLDTLVCSQHMGLHSSVGKSTAVLTQRPLVPNPYGTLKLKFAIALIALFTVSFSQLHYNAIPRGCEAISGLNYKIARNCFTYMLEFHCNAHEQG